jgi:hypothetical protein
MPVIKKNLFKQPPNQALETSCRNASPEARCRQSTNVRWHEHTSKQTIEAMKKVWI